MAELRVRVVELMPATVTVPVMPVPVTTCPVAIDASEVLDTSVYVVEQLAEAPQAKAATVAVTDTDSAVAPAAHVWAAGQHAPPSSNSAAVHAAPAQ
jgi:hypothetical protein